MQQFCRITFYAVESLFHQSHVGMTTLAAFVRGLAAVFCIRILLITKLIKLFHGIGLDGGVGQVQLSRLGTSRSSSHLALLSGSTALLLLISLPRTLFTFITLA
jgi:hypothetical protein